MMPILKGGVWYWLDNRLLSLARREVKSLYSYVELSTMDDSIDVMGIQKLMALARNHEEKWHISENVPVGKHNPIFKASRAGSLRIGYG